MIQHNIKSNIQVVEDVFLMNMKQLVASAAFN